MLPKKELIRIEKSIVQAAHEGGKVLLRYFGTRLKIHTKPDAGLVSKADIESEKTILRILKKTRPDFVALTEEFSPNAGRSQGRWIIDPLDGTTNYLRGFPVFCVSIAAEWEGEIVAGVIYHPILKETFSAHRGGGAFLNGKRIHVSGVKRLADSVLTTGFTYKKSKWLKIEVDAFERLSSQVIGIRRPGSAALDLAYTARGTFDGFWEHQLSPWDVAAGLLLVEEAGGKVTDFRNGKLDIHCGEILATNGGVHAEMLKKIRGGR